MKILYVIRRTAAESEIFGGGSIILQDPGHITCILSFFLICFRGRASWKPIRMQRHPWKLIHVQTEYGMCRSSKGRLRVLAEIWKILLKFQYVHYPEFGWLLHFSYMRILTCCRAPAPWAERIFNVQDATTTQHEALSVVRPSLRLIAFSTSSEPLDGCYWNLEGMKYSWSITSVILAPWP